MIDVGWWRRKEEYQTRHQIALVHSLTRINLLTFECLSHRETCRTLTPASQNLKISACKLVIQGPVTWSMLRARLKKHLNRVLRRDFNKAHFIPEIRVLTRCKTANESRFKTDIWARLETRFAVLHCLSNWISGISCESFKSSLHRLLEYRRL